MKSLKILWRVAANELAAWCRTSATLDYKKLESRVDHEGISFLTITLPSFCKDFERGLEQEKVDSNLFAGFSRQAGGPLPRFLGGFLRQVFDVNTGRLLDSPSTDCIFAVRQLTLMFGKILIPCSDARIRDAVRGYIQCEQEVEHAAHVGSKELYERFSRVAALLFADVFQELENELYKDSLVLPRHGPGKTADGLRGNAKFDQRVWPSRMEGMFGFIEHAAPTWILGLEKVESGAIQFLEPGQEQPVKVVLVPKTLKTPRVIAIEPTCMQYMQQALAIPLVRLLESERAGNHTRLQASKGQIGFTDQVPNRLLAMRSSVTREAATLDMSEASDRVSTRHVDHLVSRWPLVREALMVTRSSKASVPGNGIQSLAKFASMGSALCFPVEAMVFLTAIYLGIEQELNRQLTRRDILSLRGEVRVYGDDLIVPVDYVRSVIDVLELLGFKVNTGKSFWNGKFRESCGGDYYDGEDVTPVRVRREWDDLLSHSCHLKRVAKARRKPYQFSSPSQTVAQELESLVALRNLFYMKGLWQTAKHLDSVVGSVISHFPIVESTSPALGRWSASFQPMAERIHPHYHTPLVKAYVSVPKIPSSQATGFGALLKFFLKPGDEPFADERHLERQGRPEVVDTKLRWMAPY